MPQISHKGKILPASAIRKLVPFADADLIYIARNHNNEPIGFNITLPDYNQVLSKLKGRLLPFGIIKFLYYKRRIDQSH